MKIHSKRELQEIAINHSADIDHKHFMRIYKKYISEPYSFLTIDTTLPANDPLRFRKNLLLPYKNNITDKFKILDDKIKANQTQYDLNSYLLKNWINTNI